MSIDRYDPIRILGEGSFGKVYQNIRVYYPQMVLICLLIFFGKGLLDERQSQEKFRLREDYQDQKHPKEGARSYTG